MKAGAIGRLGDVTKLLQTRQKSQSVYSADFVNPWEPRLSPFLRGAHKVRQHRSASYVAIAVEKLPRRCRRKTCDALTSQSNNFGVSRKRFRRRESDWGDLMYVCRRRGLHQTGRQLDRQTNRQHACAGISLPEP